MDWYKAIMDILGAMNIGRPITCLNALNAMVMAIDMRKLWMAFRHAMATMFESMQ